MYSVLDRLGIPKSDAVYIGDSEVDIETAANAGMDCILVTWGYRDVPWLKEKGGRVFADTMDELFKLLMK